MTKKLVAAAMALLMFGAAAACGSEESKVVTQTVQATVTETATRTQERTATVTQTPPVTISSRGVLTGMVNGADSLGFVSSFARCSSGDKALMILRTVAYGKEGSKVVICSNGYKSYYRGVRDKPGDKGVYVNNVEPKDGLYVATNKDTAYYVSRKSLVIYQDGLVTSDERVVELAYRTS